MKKTIALVAVTAFALAGAAGCHSKRSEVKKKANDRIETITGEAPTAWDSLDAVMRYEVSRVDMKGREVVLVPAEVAEQEIEPQSGQELVLSFEDFRRLCGKEDPTLGDVVQSIDEGGEVIIYGKHLGMPTEADDVEKIVLPKDED